MLIRDLAETLVSLREHFLTHDGHPDWTGRTGAYRAAVHQIYSDANIPPDEATTLQAAVRYHAGNVLRERLSAQELEDLGIGAAAPRARVRTRHQERSTLLAALKGDGDDPDLLRTLSAAWALVSRVPEERVAELSAADRRKVRTLLRKIAERAESLRGG